MENWFKNLEKYMKPKKSERVLPVYRMTQDEFLKDLDDDSPRAIRIRGMRGSVAEIYINDKWHRIEITHEVS